MKDPRSPPWYLWFVMIPMAFAFIVWLGWAIEVILTMKETQ